MLAVSECFFIMATNTTIKGDTTVIVCSVIPEVFCQIISLFNKIFMNKFMLSAKSGQISTHAVKLSIIT